MRDNIPQNDIIMVKLSLERCCHYISHMRALMHMCEPPNANLENETAEKILELMSKVMDELHTSNNQLDVPSE